jgi:hypothetical protein
VETCVEPRELTFVIPTNDIDAIDFVDPGLTGHVVESVEEAVAAVGRIGQLDRRCCRTEFERRFDADRMASGYLAIYRRLAA